MLVVGDAMWDLTMCPRELTFHAVQIPHHGNSSGIHKISASQSNLTELWNRVLRRTQCSLAQAFCRVQLIHAVKQRFESCGGHSRAVHTWVLMPAESIQRTTGHRTRGRRNIQLLAVLSRAIK